MNARVAMTHTRISQKASSFTESVIREMTRLAQKHNAVNLSQGFPDFPAPQAIKDAACQAILGDINQYAVTWGAKPLRDAIAKDFTARHGVPVVEHEQITVCCGSTEAMIATMMAIVDPGDEVIVFEPYYENYGPDAILSGATPRFVRLHEPGAGRPDWAYDPDELARAFSNKTRAIIINTPNNPTGKVFTRKELQEIAALCQKWDVIAVTDEIYDHILYDGEQHVAMASLDGHGGSHRDDQQRVQDVQRDGLARGLDGGAGGSDRRHPQGARFPDRGRGGASAGRGRGGAVDADDLLPGAGVRLPGPTRSAADDSGSGGLQVLLAARRVLHHDGHQRLRLPG